MPITTAFSLVIPTYKEAKNIPELTKRIAAVDFAGRAFEVIMMDDNSEDGTKNIIADLQQVYPWLKLVTRTKDKGLSAAVIDGFTMARYPQLVCMDADLSHPPEKIPELLAALENDSADMVIGSRYIAGGSADGKWPIARKGISFVAAFAARSLLPINVQDPLSGFFAVKRDKCFSGGKLEAIGWKICLEIMIKANCKRIKEIPIHFSKRFEGYSKLNSKVIMSYLKQLRLLAAYKMQS